MARRDGLLERYCSQILSVLACQFEELSLSFLIIVSRKLVGAERSRILFAKIKVEDINSNIDC